MCGVTLTGCEEVMVTPAAAVDILNSKARVQGVHASIGLLPLERSTEVVAVLELNDSNSRYQQGVINNTRTPVVLDHPLLPVAMGNAFRRWR